MNINQAFPSKYLKAGDLGIPVVAVIATVVMEKMQEGGEKPVMSFSGTEKTLVLNKTNSRIIEKLHGADTDRWKGRRIELFATTTEFKGDVVDCIRVRAPQSVPEEPDMPEPKRQESQSEAYNQDPNEVPF